MSENKVQKQAKNNSGNVLGIYREDDWIAKVEILENRSDHEKEDYTLRVIKTLRKSRIYKSTPDGEVFNFYKLRGYAIAGFGHLKFLNDIIE